MLFFSFPQSRSQKACALKIRVLLLAFISTLLMQTSARAKEPGWNAKLDSRVRFYQMTELGAVIVGTEKSLYAIEGETGDVLWRRKNVRLDETDVAPVTGTDLALLSYEQGDRTWFEATDILTGNTAWKSDKVKGATMQMAVDLDNNLLAVVVAKDARARAREGFKRRPVVHVFNLRDGDELWKHEMSEVEMMPARWVEDEGEEVSYTLDNHHPPVFVDGRLYLFYEGVMSLDARTGKERIKERFRVNEEGLALTEADLVFDDRFIYTSGRGRVRAVSRETSRVEWEAKDVGLTPEMLLAGGLLYVRTGGQFTRLKDGETVERGPYGVSAIDARTGKTIWRYKGADKGITNIALPDQQTVLIADRDDLISLDSRTGKRLAKIAHGVKQAAFVLINERGEAVVGGQGEIAAFDLSLGRSTWRARHNPPSRGIFRSLVAVAVRAASLYFRYGGTALMAFRGIQFARAASSLRWSGLARAAGPNLTSLATNSAREYVTTRFSPFGIAARASEATRARSLARPDISAEVEERLLDRIDPASQMERLSRFLWHRRRMASLRGEWMYFYTNLKERGGQGLAGVNVNTGRTGREVRLSELDDRFIADEATGLLYISKGERFYAYKIGNL